MKIIEIKWSDKIVTKNSELKNLTEFCIKNKQNKALVSTKTIEKKKIINGIEISFIPMKKLCLEMSAVNILLCMNGFNPLNIKDLSDYEIMELIYCNKNKL
jgi:hypothetical protein